MPEIAEPRLPVLQRQHVTVPLTSFVRPLFHHYFSGRAERPQYRVRRYDFAGDTALLPLARAFLDTCAADRDTDYRYLFTLLGSELAANAIRHSRSGQPGGSYTLEVTRSSSRLRLACRDRGSPRNSPYDITGERHLAPVPGWDAADAVTGRGLALVDSLASEWGDNGRADFRSVWFALDYDLSGSVWGST